MIKPLLFLCVKMSVPMAELSEYEQLRVRNILRNEAELRRLGLDVSAVTNAALGRNAPTVRTRRKESSAASNLWTL